MSIRVRNVEPSDIDACVEFLRGADGRIVSRVFGTREAAASIADARYVLVAWEERPRQYGGDRISGLVVGEADDGTDGVEVRLTMAVRDSAASDGAATTLMNAAFASIAFDQDVCRLVVAVPPLNARGRLLADCYGLTEEGLVVAKDEDELNGATLWAKALHREAAGEGEPLFYLEDVVDAMEEQGDEATAYGDIKSGNVKVDYHFSDEWGLGFDDFDEDEEEEDDEGDPGASWRELPDRYQMHDMGAMRTFARAHGGAVTDDLLNATHGRGAYRRFKDACADHNLLGAYYAYQRDAHREVAIGWFEDNGLAWTEGSRPTSPRLVVD